MYSVIKNQHHQKMILLIAAFAIFMDGLDSQLGSDCSADMSSHSVADCSHEAIDGDEMSPAVFIGFSLPAYVGLSDDIAVAVVIGSIHHSLYFEPAGFGMIMNVKFVSPTVMVSSVCSSALLTKEPLTKVPLLELRSLRMYPDAVSVRTA